MVGLQSCLPKKLSHPNHLKDLNVPMVLEFMILSALADVLRRFEPDEPW